MNRSYVGAIVCLNLLCAGVFAGEALITKDRPVKIMPVGDSITEGKYTQGGYRQPLLQLLKSGGYEVTFVGKEDNGEAANETGFSKGMTNANHEGYGSARIVMLLNGGTVEGHTALPIKTTMENNKPDVVLVMLGTNDVMGGVPAKTMQETMEKLLDGIFAANKDAAVVLASIPPITRPGLEAKNKAVDEYNRLVPKIVEKEQGKGRKIAFADMHSVFPNGEGLTGDKVHPNAEGYKGMAALWYSVLTGDSK
jgi:lysophospholipase L1-like esterase